MKEIRFVLSSLTLVTDIGDAIRPDHLVGFDSYPPTFVHAQHLMNSIESNSLQSQKLQESGFLPRAHGARREEFPC
jgi:hypothetical protein